MILNLTVKNFLSIKGEQTLSFEATAENKYYDYFVREAGKYKVLKLGVIYGANASGKTNILKALDLLRVLVVKSRDADSRINFIPFKFDSDYAMGNCKMKLQFLLESESQFIEHTYEIEFNENEIVSEILNYYPGTQPALIYSRTKSEKLEKGFNLKIGSKVNLKKEDQYVLESATLRNTTILSAFNKVNPTFSMARRVRKWFDGYLGSLINPYNMSVYEKIAESYFKKSVLRQSVLNEFMKNADYNITSFDFIEEKEEMTKEMNSFSIKLSELIYSIGGDNQGIEKLTKELKGMESIDRIKKIITHKFEYNEENKEGKLPYNLESNGTKRSFELAAPLILSLIKSNLLLIDEIEASLHFDLVKYLILVFLANSGNSQMLFTTHNLLLMDWDILRNDVVWFTDKKADGSTDLYSLAEFNELNRSSVFKRYMSGQFGAKPDIYDYKLNIGDLREENDGKED